MHRVVALRCHALAILVGWSAPRSTSTLNSRSGDAAQDAGRARLAFGPESCAAVQPYKSASRTCLSSSDQVVQRSRRT